MLLGLGLGLGLGFATATESELGLENALEPKLALELAMQEPRGDLPLVRPWENVSMRFPTTGQGPVCFGMAVEKRLSLALGK